MSNSYKVIALPCPVGFPIAECRKYAVVAEINFNPSVTTAISIGQAVTKAVENCRKANFDVTDPLFAVIVSFERPSNIN